MTSRSGGQLTILSSHDLSSSLPDLFPYCTNRTTAGTWFLFLHLLWLIADPYDQFPSRLSARQVGLGLPHTLRSKGILVEDVDPYDPLTHGVKKELRVVSALLGRDHVVPLYRTKKFDVLL